MSRRTLAGVVVGLATAAITLLPAQGASADRVCASVYYWALGSGPHDLVNDCFGPDPGWGSDSGGGEAGPPGIVRVGVDVSVPAPVFGH